MSGVGLVGSPTSELLQDVVTGYFRSIPGSFWYVRRVRVLFRSRLVFIFITSVGTLLSARSLRCKDVAAHTGFICILPSADH